MPPETDGPVIRLAERVRPYNEIIAAAAGAVAILSAGISWGVAHFATVEELKRLECTSEVNLITKSLPLYSSVLTVKIDFKWSQLAEAKRNRTAEGELKVKQLENDIKDLSDEGKLPT